MNSRLIISKNIGMDRDYVNVVDYSSEQIVNLCMSESHLVYQADDFRFIKNQKSIFVPTNYNDLLTANYIAFQNRDYSNKWFFAWIDDVILHNNGTCEVSFTIDVWSTWFDNWQPKTCYTIREHVNNDAIGVNTVPENLDIGEIIQDGEDYNSLLYVSSHLIIECNYSPFGDVTYSGVTVHNGQIFGSRLYAFQISLGNIETIDAFIKSVAQAHADSIQNLYIVPSVLVSEQLVDYFFTYDGNNYTCSTVKSNMTIKEIEQNRTKKYSYSDYTCKNNKLYCYPYNYLYVTNHNGNSNIYKYEDFNSETCIFKIVMSLNVGVSARLIPLNYKGSEENDEESIPLGKFPTCSWSTDSFTNWLTQQAINLPSKLLAVGGTIAGQVATENYVGAGLTVAGTIVNEIGAFNQAKLLPNVEQGTNTSDVTYARGKNTFTFKNMRAKTEYLKIADDYLSRFGYKITRVKIPNLTGRRYWNYIEIGKSEDILNGSVPSNYMETINNACRKGVTIWHSHENIGNYNLINSII